MALYYSRVWAQKWPVFNQTQDQPLVCTGSDPMSNDLLLTYDSGPMCLQIDRRDRDIIVLFVAGNAFLTLALQGSTTRFLIAYLGLDSISAAQVSDRRWLVSHFLGSSAPKSSIRRQFAKGLRHRCPKR